MDALGLRLLGKIGLLRAAKEMGACRRIEYTRKIADIKQQTTDLEEWWQIDRRVWEPRINFMLCLLNRGIACVWTSEEKNWVHGSKLPDYSEKYKSTPICKVSILNMIFLDRFQGYCGHKYTMNEGGECGFAGAGRSPLVGGTNPRNTRNTTDLTDRTNKHTDRGLYKADSSDLNHIFVRSVEGRHDCIQIRKGMDVLGLKMLIHNILGTPAIHQNLVFSGQCMQDHHTLQHYGVANDSTVTINLRLRGGCKGTSSKTTGSFRDAVKGKEPMNHRTAPASEPPGPYIVEQKQETPLLTVEMPEVTDLHSDLLHNAVICRFNGYWPKADVLHQWVFTAWSPKCEIYLCPKGFFIVRFNTELERDSIINQGPWFWGNAGLFITPWFPEFDANTMVVSTIPVWVRLHNLPLHFWHRKALTAIGNSLGKHLKTDEDRTMRGLFTYARICVEVDLSQGLPDHITLSFNNTLWTQNLDYENTAFRCRRCMQTWHLQNACPLTSKEPRGNRKQQKKPKGWQNTEPLEEEALNTEPIDVQMSQGTAPNQGDKNPSEETYDQALQQDLQLELSGVKRAHSPEGSESEQEQPGYSGENQLAVIEPSTSTGVWCKVEKKKGRRT